ncbi:MAG: hypothetical protein V7L27_09890 [Nostoc sp.]
MYSKRLCLSSSPWRRSLPESVPSLEAGNQSGQGLYLFLVPFGYSAKQIPQVMKHIGTVWQDERYDRIVRNDEEFQQYWEYIRQNPVKAGLSSSPEDYPFFWQVPE